MQSFNPNDGENTQPDAPAQSFAAGRVAEFPSGNAKTVSLPSGDQVAVYHVNGEYYATEDRCPHQGARLADGILCEHVIECGLHGWQFDVRSGECLTVSERIKTYKVVVEDGTITVIY